VKNNCEITVWLPEELELALRRLAEEDDRKLSAYVRIILQHHVEYCERAKPQKPETMRRGSERPVSDREQRIANIATRVRANLQRQDDPE